MKMPCLVSLCFLFLQIHAEEFSNIKHVIIIGVDGLSPDGIQKANTPVLDELMKNGAYSFTAQAVLPTTSSPNWASMIMGAPPKAHGIKSNSWETKHARKKTFCGNGTGEIFPTIFRVIRENHKEAVIACFHDWSGFGRLVEPTICTVKENINGEDKTIKAAVTCIEKHQPLFAFIHLDHVDHAGHTYGHGTSEYYKAVEKMDALVGEIIASLKEAGMFENTVILVTADHGGKGKGHGGNSPEETTIPWIISGPHVKSGFAISENINTYDTAVTIAYILNLKAPDCWEGKAIQSAFSEK